MSATAQTTPNHGSGTHQKRTVLGIIGLAVLLLIAIGLGRVVTTFGLFSPSQAPQSQQTQQAAPAAPASTPAPQADLQVPDLPPQPSAAGGDEWYEHAFHWAGAVVEQTPEWMTITIGLLIIAALGLLVLRLFGNTNLFKGLVLLLLAVVTVSVFFAPHVVGNWLTEFLASLPSTTEQVAGPEVSYPMHEAWVDVNNPGLREKLVQEPQGMLPDDPALAGGYRVVIPPGYSSRYVEHMVLDIWCHDLKTNRMLLGKCPSGADYELLWMKDGEESRVIHYYFTPA